MSRSLIVSLLVAVQSVVAPGSSLVANTDNHVVEGLKKDNFFENEGGIDSPKGPSSLTSSVGFSLVMQFAKEREITLPLSTGTMNTDNGSNNIVIVPCGVSVESNAAIGDGNLPSDLDSTKSIIRDDCSIPVSVSSLEQKGEPKLNKAARSDQEEGISTSGSEEGSAPKPPTVKRPPPKKPANGGRDGGSAKNGQGGRGGGSATNSKGQKKLASLPDLPKVIDIRRIVQNGDESYSSLSDSDNQPSTQQELVVPNQGGRLPTFEEILNKPRSGQTTSGLRIKRVVAPKYDTTSSSDESNQSRRPKTLTPRVERKATPPPVVPSFPVVVPCQPIDSPRCYTPPTESGYNPDIDITPDRAAAGGSPLTRLDSGESSLGMNEMNLEQGHSVFESSEQDDILPPYQHKTRTPRKQKGSSPRLWNIPPQDDVVISVKQEADSLYGHPSTTQERNVGFNKKK